MEEKIRFLMILEVMGRPKEYIVESLKGIVDRIEEEKDIKIVNKKIAEPKQIKDKDLFSTFAELEIEAKESLVLFRLIFTYLPSHIEIISPSEFKLKNFDWSSVCNEIIRTLHKYDELAKIMIHERNILEKKLKEVIGEQGGGVVRVDNKKTSDKRKKKAKKEKKI